MEHFFQDISNWYNRIDKDLLNSLLSFDAHQPLLFNTGLFMLLFVGFILLYQLLRRHNVAKMLMVIAFSLYFYYKSSAWCCLILLGVCVSDYLLGLWMGATTKNSIRRLIVALNVVANVGMLVYFKYFNMLLESFHSFTNTHFEPWDIILPAGISFFTFRSISYIVDLYRRKLEPCRNVLDYVFFLTFFPPLLAGPVVRAVDMLPQIKANDPATRAMVGEGLFLIMSGLIKKVVIADYISGNFVDRIFENPSLYSGLENVLGTLGFTLQLYCDFSGYSDMAIGLALLMGYRFKDNFNAPFKSQSPTEFWRRWHISLSTWLRDYIYIPLGGNRKGKARQHVNLMSTMVIGGLWHGASWMYLLWGAYHGALLIGHKSIKAIWPEHRMMRYTNTVRFVNVLITFTLVVIGFTFFRCSDLTKLSEMGTQIFTAFHPEVAMQFAKAYALILTAMGVGYIMHFSPSSWRNYCLNKYISYPLIIQSLILAVVLFIVVQTRRSELVPFVYLQY